MSTYPVTDWSYVFCVAMSVLFIICIIGNILILIIVYKNEVFGNTCQARLLISNAAIIDLIASLGCLTAAVGYIDIKLTTVDVLCRYDSPRQWMFTLLSHFSHVFLATSRYYSVAKPFTANAIFSRRVGITLVSCSWVCVTIIGSVIEIIADNSNPLTADQSSCMGRMFGSDIKVLFQLLVMCCVVAIVIINARTWRVDRMRINRVNNVANRRNALRPNINQNITKPILLISVYYVVSFVPAFVLISVASFAGRRSVLLTRFARLLFLSNHANNAIVFFLANRRFRERIKRLFIRSLPPAATIQVSGDY